MAEQETTTQADNPKPFGRPTKLTAELIYKAREHVEAFDVSTYTLLPTIEGLALELRISRDTVYEWEKENTDFSDIVTELRAKQANKLIQNSLAGKYNASIAKLILSGKHGYVEKSEQDLTTNGKDIIQPILVKFVGDDDTTND